MEPNNFEKDFREKLNERKIEPSDKAWDRLDAMLSLAENKKPEKKKQNRWLYIAASVVGFLLVGTFFFNQKKEINEPSKIDVVIKEDAKKDTIEKPTLSAIDSAKTAVAISEKEIVEKSEKEKQSDNVRKQNKPIKNEQKQIAESSVITKNNQEKQSINKPTSVAENSKKENVDQLLEAAEKSIVAENSTKQKKVKINADDLLNQVDGELEQSFREKVITKVNKNYQTVKVALANRNQQE
ncbi:hypothetical protein [Flavobacterium hibernum]|uniref:Uncharacterized protein n=1 Tax=Flavobacterium hibernum TaxID=37752 RepID=A0A0D0F025_9FLAO|nr:hypothetical protein [Flavobacterium hibernum]KIO52951.1 hypothetical protein IW18_10505 [Flavobacterium hibernum]OXA88594.1 hypothetical protein B0A73_07920 [Flavobacterium hibernum]STO15269.1 Uncharacterised protein [Flavobacterium hibernum]